MLRTAQDSKVAKVRRQREAIVQREIAEKKKRLHEKETRQRGYNAGCSSDKEFAEAIFELENRISSGNESKPMVFALKKRVAILRASALRARRKRAQRTGEGETSEQRHRPMRPKPKPLRFSDSEEDEYMQRALHLDAHDAPSEGTTKAGGSTNA